MSFARIPNDKLISKKLEVIKSGNEERTLSNKRYALPIQKTVIRSKNKIGKTTTYGCFRITSNRLSSFNVRKVFQSPVAILPLSMLPSFMAQ